MTMLSDVKAVQPEWFSPKNRKFFGDKSYRVLHGKKSGKPYLVRSTYAWSDLFDQPRTLSWRINRLHDNLEIGELLDDVFTDYHAVRIWLLTEGENGTENSND